MDNLKLGDVLIRGDGDLGFSAEINGKQVLWINHKGEVALLKWLAKKNNWRGYRRRDTPVEEK